ncbi:MAG: alpha/beta fold hydrolase [Gemmatimonadales bacterium]|nr:alpha/beta fold hydrolase [Gemmatimonadales bacterium]
MRHVRGVEIFERRHGEGPEVIVLHGGPGAHHDYLLPGFDALAKRRTLVYYDQRGGGRSPVARDAPVGWREHVADLEALRDVWGLDTLHLCGYSWGALLAMLYAITHPNRVASLALVSPAPAARQEREEYEAVLAVRSSTPEIRAARDALQQEGLRATDPAAHAQRLFELAVAGYFHDPSRAGDLTPFRVTGRTQQQVWESMGDDFDLRPALRALKVDAIVVHGDDDPIPVSTAAATADALGAPLVVLEDCGHVPYVEALDAFVAALDPFLPHA